MDFVAIDFETANNERSSACSIGLVYVNRGMISQKEYFLFRPAPFYFTNSHIHGIYEQDVENMPSFCESWNEILPKIEDKLIVAHNAAFDLSVLRATLSSSVHDFPNLNYICTWRLSQVLLKELANHRLSTISKHFGIELNHHHALSDAEACAQLALILAKKNDEKSLLELSKKCGFKIGQIHDNNTYTPFSISGGREVRHKREQNIESLSFVDNMVSEKLLGNKVVISGVFTQFSRTELKKIIEQHGGKNVGSISKKTTFVVAGENMGPSKRQKAEDLGIPLITEEEFIQKIS